MRPRLIIAFIIGLAHKLFHLLFHTVVLLAVVALSLGIRLADRLRVRRKSIEQEAWERFTPMMHGPCGLTGRAGGDPNSGP